MPVIEQKGASLVFKAINKTNLNKLNKGCYWRIKYKDFNDKITTRTIYKPFFFILGELDKEGNKISIDYLKANCILRNHEERYFRIDRIQKIEVLDLSFSGNEKK